MVTMRDVYTLVSCTFTLCRTSDQTDLQTPSALTVWTTVSWDCYAIARPRAEDRDYGQPVSGSMLDRCIVSFAQLFTVDCKVQNFIEYISLFICSLSLHKHIALTHLMRWGSFSRVDLVDRRHTCFCCTFFTAFDSTAWGRDFVGESRGVIVSDRLGAPLQTRDRWRTCFQRSLVQPWTWGKPANCEECSDRGEWSRWIEYVK